MTIKISAWGTRWLSISGVLIALLGVVHLAATPGVMGGIPESVPAEFRLAFLFMFAAAGLGVVFAGILIIGAAIGMARHWPGARILGFSAGIFTTLLGIGAVAAMPGNPFSYVLLFLGLSVLPSLVLSRRGRFEGGDVLDFHRDAPDEKRTFH